MSLLRRIQRARPPAPVPTPPEEPGEAGETGTIHTLWIANTQTKLLTTAITPDNRFIFAGGLDGTLLCFDITGRLLWSGKVSGSANRIALANDAETLLVGTLGSGNQATLWHYDGRLLYTFNTDGNTNGVAITPDGALIVVGSMDQHLYGFERNGTLRFKQAVDGGLWSAAVTADGARIFAGSDRQRVHAFDQAGAPLWTFESDRRVWAGVRMAEGARRLMVGSNDGHVYALDFEGQTVWRCDLGGPVNNVAVTPDGAWCAAAGQPNFVALIDGQGRLVWHHTIEQSAYGVSISDDGRYVLFGGKDENAYAYDHEEDRVIWQAEKAGTVYSTALSTSGAFGAVASASKHLQFIHNPAVLDARTLASPPSRTLIRLVTQQVRASYGNTPHHAVVRWFSEFERSLRSYQFDVCEALLHDATESASLGLSADEQPITRSLEGALWLFKGTVHHRLGQIAEARACYERSRAIHDDIHNLDGAGQAIALLSALPEPREDDPSGAPPTVDTALLDEILARPRVLGSAENLLSVRIATASPADQQTIVLLAKEEGYLRPLVEALRASDPAIRSSAAAALALLDPGPGPDVVEELLSASEGFVRWQGLRLVRYRAHARPDAFAAAKAQWWPCVLEPHGPSEVPDPLVRREQALVVQEGGSEDDIPWLLDRLYDPDPDVQIAVADALGEIGDRRAIPWLKRVETHQRFLGPNTRMAADKAIATIESRHPLPSVTSIIFTSDDPQRQATVKQHALFLPDTTTVYAIVTVEHAGPDVEVTARWLDDQSVIREDRQLTSSAWPAGTDSDAAIDVQTTPLVDDLPARPGLVSRRSPFGTPSTQGSSHPARRDRAAETPEESLFEDLFDTPDFEIPGVLRRRPGTRPADADPPAPTPTRGRFPSSRSEARPAVSLPYENEETHPSEDRPRLGTFPPRNPLPDRRTRDDFIPEFLRRPMRAVPPPLAPTPATPEPSLARRWLFPRREASPRSARPDSLFSRRTPGDIPEPPRRRPPFDQGDIPPRPPRFGAPLAPFQEHERRPPSWLRDAFEDSDSTLLDRRMRPTPDQNHPRLPATPAITRQFVFALPCPDTGWQIGSYRLEIELDGAPADAAEFQIVGGVRLVALEPGHVMPNSTPAFSPSPVFLTRTPAVTCRAHLRDAVAGLHLTGRLIRAATDTVVDATDIVTTDDGQYTIMLSWRNTGWQPGIYRAVVSVEGGGELSTEITLIARLHLDAVRLCHRVDDDGVPIGTQWPFYPDDTPHCVVELGSPPPGIEIQADWHNRSDTLAATHGDPYVTTGDPDQQAVFDLGQTGNRHLVPDHYSILIKGRDIDLEERSFQVLPYPLHRTIRIMARNAHLRALVWLKWHRLDSALSAGGWVLLLTLFLTLAGAGLDRSMDTARVGDPILRLTRALGKVTPAWALAWLAGAALYGGVRTRVSYARSRARARRIFETVDRVLAFAASGIVWYWLTWLLFAPGFGWPGALWGLFPRLLVIAPAAAWLAPLAALAAAGYSRGSQTHPFGAVALLIGETALITVMAGYTGALILGLSLGALGGLIAAAGGPHGLGRDALGLGAVIGFGLGPLCAALVYFREGALLLWDSWYERKQQSDAPPYSLLDHFRAGHLVPLSSTEWRRIAGPASLAALFTVLLTAGLLAGYEFDHAAHPDLALSHRPGQRPGAYTARLFACTRGRIGLLPGVADPAAHRLSPVRCRRPDRERTHARAPGLRRDGDRVAGDSGAAVRPECMGWVV